MNGIGPIIGTVLRSFSLPNLYRLTVYVTCDGETFGLIEINGPSHAACEAQVDTCLGAAKRELGSDLYVAAIYGSGMN